MEEAQPSLSRFGNGQNLYRLFAEKVSMLNGSYLMMPYSKAEPA
jgi:hypothetical protein